MPDFAHARLPAHLALDEAVAVVFRTIEAAPVPAALLRLVDRLEAASEGRLRAELPAD